MGIPGCRSVSSTGTALNGYSTYSEFLSRMRTFAHDSACRVQGSDQDLRHKLQGSGARRFEHITVA